MSTTDNYDELSNVQRLKAAVHHTTLKICRDCAKQNDVEISPMVVATIAEATWKKFEEYTTDLELFAKHAKRTTITTDDVKMLARKNPKLLEFLNEELKEINAAKETKKKKRAKPVSEPGPSTSTSTAGASTHDNNDDD